VSHCLYGPACISPSHKHRRPQRHRIVPPIEVSEKPIEVRDDNRQLRRSSLLARCVHSSSGVGHRSAHCNPLPILGVKVGVNSSTCRTQAVLGKLTHIQIINLGVSTPNHTSDTFAYALARRCDSDSFALLGSLMKDSREELCGAHGKTSVLDGQL
jgi:hypothetical protein